MNAPGERSQEEIPLGVWDPERYVRAVDPIEARLSRGFLRCRPERWFPGFGAQWLPLVHSLGLEVAVRGVRPALAAVVHEEHAFYGEVDGEQILLTVDPASARVIVEAFCPALYDLTGGAKGASVVLEYAARRLLGSLVLAWTGPQPSVARFLGEISGDSSADGPIAGAIELLLNLNGKECSVWIGVGVHLAERLDGLWRRQLASTLKGNERASEISIEVAQLAVPPSMLVEYTRRGTIVDLEVPLSDNVILRQGGKPWLSARLGRLRGALLCETLAGQVPAPVLPEGTTRLSLQFGSFMVEPAALAELAQPGAMFETALELSDRVAMVINGEKVADATLCTYEGRFAVSVN